MPNVPVIGAVPVAVSCVEEFNVVERPVLPKNTCAPVTKLLPVTVSVKLPVGKVIGETDVSTGVGFQMVTLLVPVAEESAELTAVMMMEFELGKLLGAV